MYNFIEEYYCNLNIENNPADCIIIVVDHENAKYYLQIRIKSVYSVIEVSFIMRDLL